MVPNVSFRRLLGAALAATIAPVFPITELHAQLAAPVRPPQTTTVCLDGDVGDGARLRRAVLALRYEGSTLTAGELEMHGRPLQTTPLQFHPTVDGSIHATARDSATPLTLRIAAIGTTGETRGMLTVGASERELRLRTARPAPEAGWAVGDWRSAAAFFRVGMHVSRGLCGLLAGTFDSPDQGQLGLPWTAVREGADTVVLEAQYMGMTISITRGASGEVSTGALMQGGVETGLTIERGAWSSGVGRSQDPKPPFPYEERAAQYDGRAPGIRLAGTLTVPREPGLHPALVLISGSGAQDRDELVAGHRPFLVLADSLTRRGYAVLRVDDRGVGGSTGDVLKARLDDLADDVQAGIEWLRAQPGIDPARIGLLGHSEGGLIAPMVAARDSRISFVVLLGGPAMKGRALLLEQRSALSAAAGDSDEARRLDLEFVSRVFDALDSRPADADLEARVDSAVSLWLASLPAPKRVAADAMLASRTAAQDAASFSLWRTRWFQSLYHHDPEPFLKRTRVPVLAIYGDLDLQVLAAPNAQALSAALGAAGNRDVTVVRLSGVNHMMQPAKTGRIEEYSQIEETIVPAVLQAIGDFLVRVAPRRHQ
jgi:uncharacterized protein